MSQAAATSDINSPAAGQSATSLSSADDLLAQLAGEEIDRLLAEDEPDNTPQATARGGTDNAASVANQPDQLDALLEQIDQNPPASVPQPAMIVDAPVALPSAPVTSTASALAAEMEADARDGTLGLLNDSPSHAAELSPASDDAKPLPIYVRLLEVLSSPLDEMPESVRECAGKVAILTFFNSLAVLLYVLIFRRHCPREDQSFHPSSFDFSVCV